MKLQIKDAYSVIGLGYGDEGKGTVVDYLVSKCETSIVYRHSGGHQVGHTVMIGDKLHEFRHFGSGTLRGKATIWDHRCTVSPLQFEIEYKQIQREFNITPKLYVDNLCPVTTLYDIAYNRAKEKQYKDGSTGVGFAATLKRSELVPLYVIDLEYKFVLDEKLKNVRNYYFKKVESEGISDLYASEISELSNVGYTLDCFIESCKYFFEHTFVSSAVQRLEDFDTVIFEGNQGVLLDKFHGFFPNVTYGYTTNRKVKYDQLNTFYVSRCYATRHGFGPLKNENLDAPELINTEFEQNRKNPYQDNFRTAILDFDLVRYAINCDKSYNKNASSSLVMTCMDQYVNPKMTQNDEVVDFDLYKFACLVDHMFVNVSPDSKTMIPWR